MLKFKQSTCTFSLSLTARPNLEQPAVLAPWWSKQCRYDPPPPPPPSTSVKVRHNLQAVFTQCKVAAKSKDRRKEALVPGRTDTHWPQADGRGSWFDRNLRRFSQLGFSAVLDGQSTTPGQSCPSAMSSIVRGRLFFTEMLECHSRTRQTDANSPSFDDVVSLY